MSVSSTGNPSIVLAAVDAAFEQAEAAGNHFAVWVTAVAGTIAAATGQATDAGLHWSDVLLDLFGWIGEDPPVPALEIRGVLLLTAGRPLDAIRSIASSRSLARRIGGSWPSPGTLGTLEAARSHVAPDDAERAYKQGLLDRSYASSSLKRVAPGSPKPA